MVKIALDASCLVLNPSSGLAEVVRNLVAHLPLVTKRHKYALFMNYFRKGPETDVPSSFDEETNVLRVPRRIVDWWWRRNWPSFDTYLRGVDVFHGLHAQVPPTKKVKTVLTVHDCRFLAFPKLYSENTVQHYRNQMTRSLSRADLVVTDSEFTRQELLSYFSISEDRVRVIHCGINADIRSTKDGEGKAQRFLIAAKIPQSYLLYLGVLEPRKNLRNLLEAFARCKETIHDFPHLLLVGIDAQHWAHSDEARTAKELGLSGHIHLTGVLEKELVWALIRKALVLCYPSLYEGFGFPPLEAMSVGTPVLASRTSSIPEVTGNAACLVNPLEIEEMAAGLSKIVNDSDYRQNLIQLGYQRVTQFSWQKTAEQYAAVYQEVATS